MFPRESHARVECLGRERLWKKLSKWKLCDSLQPPDHVGAGENVKANDAPLLIDFTILYPLLEFQ